MTNLIGDHLFNNVIGTFPLLVHDKCNSNSQTSNNLLVLSFMGVGEHFLEDLFGLGTKHDETHGVSSTFTGSSAILVKNRSEVSIDF